jgi:hypothetical protein
MCAQKYMLLPQEDAAAFAALETTILAELAPKGALQTLLARRVQAEPAEEHAAGAEVLEMPARLPSRPAPNAPEHRAPNEYVIPDQPGPGRTLHEPVAPWTPNEPEPERSKHSSSWRAGQHPLRASMRATESQDRMDRMHKCRTNG